VHDCSNGRLENGRAAEPGCQADSASSCPYPLPRDSALRAAFRRKSGVVGFQADIAVLQIQYVADASKVDARIDQLGDAGESGHVVIAVATGAAIGSRGRDQSSPLVQAQRLRIYPRQLGGHRDAVDAACRSPRRIICRQKFSDRCRFSLEASYHKCYIKPMADHTDL
jgi:hypothetical protein